MTAMARDAFTDFEGFQFQFIKIDDFPALTEAALHEKAREGFLGLVRCWEFDVPEVGAGIEKVDGVKESIGLLVDFGDNACTGAFPDVAVLVAAEMEFLAGGEFFGEAQNAAIPADEQGFGGLLESGACGRGPGGFHGHAEADTVTLAESIG